MPYNRENRSGGNRGKRYSKPSFGGRSFGGRDGGRPTMHQAICSECNKECEVPFKPIGDRPVLCRDCFGGKGGDSGPRRSSGRDFSDRKMYQATCDTCGKECEVPFRPSGDKPVYCLQCFNKNSGKNSGNGNSGNMSSEQFEILNSKLDKILDVLGSIE